MIKQSYLSQLAIYLDNELYLFFIYRIQPGGSLTGTYMDDSVIESVFRLWAIVPTINIALPPPCLKVRPTKQIHWRKLATISVLIFCCTLLCCFCTPEVTCQKLIFCWNLSFCHWYLVSNGGHHCKDHPFTLSEHWKYKTDHILLYVQDQTLWVRLFIICGLLQFVLTYCSFFFNINMKHELPVFI